MLPVGESSTVRDRTSRPPGVLPRHVQTWVVLGIAAVMTGVIAISGPSRPAETRRPSAARAGATEPSDAHIQEYRTRVDEEARRLVAAQAALEAARRAADGAAQAAARAGGPGGGDPTIDASFEREKARREYQALFADSLALTLRLREAPAAAVQHDTAIGPRDETASRRDAPTNDLVPEGTVIEAVLTNRLDGSFAGPVNAMVTAAVYSKDRQRVLIPTGSRLLGEAKAVTTFGQQRLAVTFHRLLMPDGRSVALDRAKAPEGLGQAGETGLRDRVDHHYAQLFGVSVAIGLIGGLTQADARIGLGASGVDLYKEGVASSAAQSSLHILDRFLNVLPTVTIREGQRLKVYLAGDLALPAAGERS